MKKIKVLAIVLLSALVIIAGVAIAKDATVQISIPKEMLPSTLCILPWTFWQT